MSNVVEILSRLRKALSDTDREWDVGVGSPVYKILEAVSMEIAEVYDSYRLFNFNFNIDTKTGYELESFVEMFGLVRLKGKRATGTVTFSRGTPDHTMDYTIPAGTQTVKPATAASPAIYFQTTSAATISAGATQAEVPAEAVVAGSSGNVNVNTISLFAGAIPGVTAVTNYSPFTGGRDSETDEELRARWRVTLFRNMAGTEDQFLSVALISDRVSRALVVGASKRVREQLQISAGQVQSGIVDFKYRYPQGSEFVGTNLGMEEEEIAVPFTDYTWDPNTGVVNFIGSRFPDGTIVDFEHDYLPEASRNDPENGVYHKIDVFIAGQDGNSAIEEVNVKIVPANAFTDTADSMDVSNWLREDQVTNPTVGNYFMPLFNTPVISAPSTITVGTTIYELGTDYWLVHDITENKNSTRSRDGIEWSSASNPGDGVNVVVDYAFNALIREIDEQIRLIRLVGTDTLVHRADYARLRFNLSVTFNRTYSAGTETENIAAALSEWLESKDFRGDVEIADMVDVIMQLKSVDNVRLTTQTEDAVDYGIQEIARDGNNVLNTHTSDIYFGSHQIPVLESVVVNTRGTNTF